MGGAGFERSELDDSSTRPRSVMSFRPFAFRVTTSLLAILLFILPATTAAQPVDSLLARGKMLLDRGTTTGDVAALQQARSLFERATAVDSLAAYSHYYLALADYRLIDVVEDDQGERYIDDAAKYLEAALDRREGWTEANALLSLVYGRKAGQGMFSGMRYGPKASSRLDDAKGAAPDNPRVLLADGISLLNKPSMWGGDEELGLKRLQEAVRQFEQRATSTSETTSPSSNSLEPTWGHAEAYAWIGIAHAKADRHDEARTAFQQALSERPEYAWVEKVLMPKLASAE